MIFIWLYGQMMLDCGA